jgi:NADPH-dependent 2,4-dienoyl-CoA reductase/sulfur reductase-like enzyme
MVVGRINDPRLAEDILRRNQADVIVMGRALLADPELPNKTAEGRFDDIAPCVGCGLGCITCRAEGRPMTCIINPTVGREREMIITPAAKPKKVMVVGAGPGGLEAARVAVLRGHQVTLYEKDAEPGAAQLAAVPPMSKSYRKVSSTSVPRQRRPELQSSGTRGYTGACGQGEAGCGHRGQWCRAPRP